MEEEEKKKKRKTRRRIRDARVPKKQDSLKQLLSDESEVGLVVSNVLSLILNFIFS